MYKRTQTYTCGIHTITHVMMNTWQCVELVSTRLCCLLTVDWSLYLDTDAKQLQLQMIDTAAWNEFPAMQSLFVQMSHLVMIVYDVTCTHWKETLTSVVDAVKKIKGKCNNLLSLLLSGLLKHGMGLPGLGSVERGSKRPSWPRLLFPEPKPRLGSGPSVP